MTALDIRGGWGPPVQEILDKEAKEFLMALESRFRARREAVLEKRKECRRVFDCGGLPNFREDTTLIRQQEWQVASPPADLEQRWVEMTGPVDPKMIIHALNSGASGFMADFEDAHAPTWDQTIRGQQYLKDAVRGTLRWQGDNGKNYELKQGRRATLHVRPRGWHLAEAHVEFQKRPMSASLFDFALFAYHNAQELLTRGSGPYFYLPKLESAEEAKLWNEVFAFSEGYLDLPEGSIRATVLIETIPAAFEMEEILYELRNRIVGLNAGRWDYIFSMIKCFRNSASFILPDRQEVSMEVPFMKAYCELLVNTCHRRGAHAIGGMAALVPSRKDEKQSQRALEAVQKDKEREIRQGFDGTWVAHPDLVPHVWKVFEKELQDQPHQKQHFLEERFSIGQKELLAVEQTVGQITHEGVRNNMEVSMIYLNQWLQGRGSVAIKGLMEDAATAEIARSQLWQWLHYRVRLQRGDVFNAAYYRRLRNDVLEELGGVGHERLGDVVEILDGLVLTPGFQEFFTEVAYSRLIGGPARTEWERRTHSKGA